MPHPIQPHPVDTGWKAEDERAKKWLGDIHGTLVSIPIFVYRGSINQCFQQHVYQPFSVHDLYNLTTLFIGSDPLTCFTYEYWVYFGPSETWGDHHFNGLRDVRYHWLPLAQMWDPSCDRLICFQDRWLWVKFSKFSTLPSSRLILAILRLYPSKFHVQNEDTQRPQTQCILYRSLVASFAVGHRPSFYAHPIGLHFRHPKKHSP